MPIDPQSLTHTQVQAALGALIGAAVGDALGAPFEFESAGLYSRTFPHPVLGGIGEMVGGGSFGWAPGEFTDDTQMAVALAESLLAHEGDFHPETTWDHFVAWSAQATDIGNTTRLALRGSHFSTAAREAHERLGRTGSNGSVMRIAPMGIVGVQWGRERTMETARRQSDLTHFDPIAGWSAAIAAEVIRACIAGGLFHKAVYEAVQLVDEDLRSEFVQYLADDWKPESARFGNGAAIVCLAQAVWAVRTTTSFEDAVTSAINLGDDADSVAAVTGALAGAKYGIQQIPARWSTYVHGTVRQPDGTMKTYRQHDLLHLAHALVGKPSRPMTPPEAIVPPAQIHEKGVFASNQLGATVADTNMGIVSLCRMEEMLSQHPFRREHYIIDHWGEGHNPYLRSVTEDAVAAIDAFLEEGRNVLVHCHGGRSRTTFILKAWYMKSFNVDHDAAHEWISTQWPLTATWNEDFMHFLDTEWMQ